MEIFNSMVLNTTLLISVSIIAGIFFQQLKKENVRSNFLYGILLGAVGIILMMNTVQLSSGLIFDTRSILVSVTGLFFGVVPTAIVVLIVSLFRIFIGGSGFQVGVLVTIVSAVNGVLWNKYRIKTMMSKQKNIWRELYFFGFITHTLMLLCMFALPGNLSLDTLKIIGLPLLIIYPFGTLMLCMIIINMIKSVHAETVLKESELKFSTVIEQAPIGITIAKESRLLIVNKAYERIVGRTREDIEGEGWKQYTHPDDLKEELQKYYDIEAGTIDKYSMQKRYIKIDGSIVWVNLIVAACCVGSEQNCYQICMIQDITEAKRGEEDLQNSESKYRELYQEYKIKQNLLQSLLDSIPDLICYKDTKSSYLGCNKAFEVFADVAEKKLIGLTDFDVFDRESASIFKAKDIELLQQQNPQIFEEKIPSPNGHTVILETLKTPYYDPEGQILGIISISRDITERKQKEFEIQYLSSHDGLTGLYNRAFFDYELKRIDRSGKLPYSVIFGDLDGLKIVNDIWGHAEGDRILIQAASLLRKCCRSNDVLARIGGDEFAILLPATDEPAAKSMYHLIMNTFKDNSSKLSQDVYKTSISMGFATKSDHEQDVENLMKIADEYMYRRKLLEQKSLHSSILSAIRMTMFEKSSETEEHAERMAELSKKIGVALGLSEYDLVSLELTATLHDIGKIGISKAILEKPESLTEEEWKEMKKHPEIGYRIAHKIPELSLISEYILCHHERWDGKGYPQGLLGEHIPLISRIVSVVDSYDAMTENRAYRKAISKEAAILEILQNANTQFDPQIAYTFVETVLREKQDQYDLVH